MADARTLGLIGSVLALIGVVPSRILHIVGLVGIILILISLKEIGDMVNNDKPFKYYLYSFIVGIIATAFLFAVVFIAIVKTSSVSTSTTQTSVHTIGPGSSEIFKVYTSISPGSSFIGYILLILVVLWIFSIIASYFRMKALRELAEVTETKEFNSAATWMWWGALTMIILVGFILVIIGWIYQILGFSNMPSDLRKKKEGLEEGWVTYDDFDNI